MTFLYKAHDGLGPAWPQAMAEKAPDLPLHSWPERRQGVVGGVRAELEANLREMQALLAAPSTTPGRSAKLLSLGKAAGKIMTLAAPALAGLAAISRAK